MAYFPHAFQKAFLPTTFVVDNTKKTKDLTPGQIALVNPKNYTVVAGSPVASTHPMLLLVQGNYHTIDKIGTHGGYTESIKSKGINPRYVHRFWKVAGSAAQNQILRVGYDGTSDASRAYFEKGKAYWLRVDVKGSPALRFMNRNLYRIADAQTGCIDECADPCAAAPEVDPIPVLIKWAEQFNNDPIFKNFISCQVVQKTVGNINHATYVEVTDPAVIPTIIAGIQITVAYADTKFGNETFDVRDHYELEPIQVYASLVDDTGNPCKTQTIAVKQTQAAQQLQGSGETIVREMILDARYRQEPFLLDLRTRQIQEGGKGNLDNVNRNGLYDSYFILHSVPRKANPSSTLDADQYLIKISVPAGTDFSAFTTSFQAYLTSAGTGVTLEDFS